MSKVVKGNVFIVPNGLRTLSSLTMFGGGMNYKALVPAPDENTLMLQIWARNEENDNWNSHGYDAFGYPTEEELSTIDDEKAKEWYKSRPLSFPSHLPLDLFIGKKEGETVSFIFHNCQVELKLDQLGARYRRFGEFEKVLRGLLSQGESSIGVHPYWKDKFHFVGIDETGLREKHVFAQHYIDAHKIIWPNDECNQPHHHLYGLGIRKDSAVETTIELTDTTHVQHRIAWFKNEGTELFF